MVLFWFQAYLPASMVTRALFSVAEKPEVCQWVLCVLYLPPMIPASLLQKRPVACPVTVAVISQCPGMPGHCRRVMSSRWPCIAANVTLCRGMRTF